MITNPIWQLTSDVLATCTCVDFKVVIIEYMPTKAEASQDAETCFNAYHEHVHTRPQPIFGLEGACADRVQSGMNMRGPAGPGGEKLGREVLKIGRKFVRLEMVTKKFHLNPLTKLLGFFTAPRIVHLLKNKILV